MGLLHKSEIVDSLKSDEPDFLFIDPILEMGQVGEVTVDLRLGYDFLVSILTRKPFIGLVKSDDGFRIVDSYFQPTRREIGDRFILYPSQVVVTTTLEYIALPSNMYADILTRERLPHDSEFI